MPAWDEQYEKIDGGWIIRSTDSHHVMLLNMGFNWRVGYCRIGVDDVPWPERAWCYPKALVPLQKVLDQALALDPGVSDPTGWVKATHTGQVACQHLYPRPNNKHPLQVPECEYCP